MNLLKTKLKTDWTATEKSKTKKDEEKEEKWKGIEEKTNLKEETNSEKKLNSGLESKNKAKAIPFSLIESFSKPTNNASVVGRLVYGDIEFLLTGDIEKKVEQHLISQNLNLESDIFKVPHHGSKTSSSYNFIKMINPQISVISVGEDNRYKHPNDEVLERLKDSVIYRTDKDGDIKILTDGILFDILTIYE